MHATDHIVSDDLLHDFAERAAGYDRENRFFQEDFDDLQRAGYLTMAVPKELGGRGLTLAAGAAASSAGSATTRPPRRSASTCTSTGSDWSPISGARATARSNGC